VADHGYRDLPEMLGRTHLISLRARMAHLSQSGFFISPLTVSYSGTEGIAGQHSSFQNTMLHFK